MEILKFSEPPKRSGRSRSSNKSGLMPLVSFGIAVLVLGGMSTTLAGTISLGTNNSVEFGQGIVTAAACDPSINVVPSTTYDTQSATFSVTQFRLTGIGVGVGDTTTAKTDVGCAGKTFILRAYTDTGVAIANTKTDGSDSRSFIGFTLPSLSNLQSITPANPTAATVDANASNGSFVSSGSWIETTSEANAGIVTITGFKLSSSVVRVTLESTS